MNDLKRLASTKSMLRKFYILANIIQVQIRDGATKKEKKYIFI